MILVLDATFLGHRAKYAMKGKELSNERMRTEIIYNFLFSLGMLAEKFYPVGMWVFCWDSRKSRRKRIYPRYKIGRQANKTDEERELDQIAYDQFNQLRKEVIPDLGFKNNLMQTGLEGDDILHSVVTGINPAGLHETKTTMVTSDNDMLQSLQHCDIYNPITQVIKTRDTFVEEWGIEPDQWAEVKAIAGCGGGKNESGDNVQGIAGVGEMTAVKYMLGKLNPTTKAFKNIEEGKKQIKLNRKVVTLPFPGTKKFEPKPHKLFSKDFLEVFTKLDFRTFLESKEFRRWERIFQLK